MPPFVGVAVNITLFPEQIELPGLAPMLTDGVTVDVTVIVIPVEVAVVGLAQASDEVITTVTTSPFVNALFEYVLLFVPTLLPFSFHWYNGVPPFVGVAVKVTLVPVQIVLPGFALILTDGTTVAVTVIVIPVDVAVVGLAQASEEVITSATTSPFANALFE